MKNMCGIKQIQSEPDVMNCDGGGVHKLLTSQEKIENLEQYQKCLEHALFEIKQKLQSLTENKPNKSNKERNLLCYLIKGTRGGKTRALILRHLTDKSYNAHQLSKVLNMDYKTVRHHLNVLIKNGIINVEKNRNNNAIYFISKNIAESLYSLNDDKIKE